jgi:hypothetical protein
MPLKAVIRRRLDRPVWGADHGVYNVVRCGSDLKSFVLPDIEARTRFQLF